MSLLYFLLIGLAAGFLAGQLMKGRGFGLVGNLIIGALISATAGAVLVLVIVGVLKREA